MVMKAEICACIYAYEHTHRAGEIGDNLFEIQRQSLTVEFGFAPQVCEPCHFES